MNLKVETGAVPLSPARRGLFSRTLPRLLGGWFVAALLPYLIRLYSLDAPDGMRMINQTVTGVIVSIALAVWLYRSISVYPGVEASGSVLTSSSLAFGALLIVLIASRVEYSRALLFISYLLTIIWLFLVYAANQRSGAFVIGVIPIGDFSACPDVTSVSWRTLGSPAACVDGINAVAIDLMSDIPNEWRRRLADFALAGIPVFHYKHLVESLTGRVELERLSENNFGTLSPVSAYMRVKHIVDWLTAAIALMVVFAPCLVLAVLIRLESPGPAIFRQRRIGYRGLSFTMLKFRSMRIIEDGRSARDVAVTETDDARITPIGRFLRRTRLDELPQILNILAGQMSWIGPRPEAEILSQWYESEIPFYRYRHIVRPGLSGWAQVNQGHVADLYSVRSKLHYDFYYIKHFSPSLDALIVGRTIRTMITGFGSK